MPCDLGLPSLSEPRMKMATGRNEGLPHHSVRAIPLITFIICNVHLSMNLLMKFVTYSVII